jgi:hypothetical protein
MVFHHALSHSRTQLPSWFHSSALPEPFTPGPPHHLPLGKRRQQLSWRMLPTDAFMVTVPSALRVTPAFGAPAHIGPTPPKQYSWRPPNGAS